VLVQLNTQHHWFEVSDSDTWKCSLCESAGRRWEKQSPHKGVLVAHLMPQGRFKTYRDHKPCLAPPDPHLLICMLDEQRKWLAIHSARPAAPAPAPAPVPAPVSTPKSLFTPPARTASATSPAARTKGMCKESGMYRKTIPGLGNLEVASHDVANSLHAEQAGGREEEDQNQKKPLKQSWAAVDDDVEVMPGTEPDDILPHLRCDCPVHRFSRGPRSAYCSECWCYVCDVRASECQVWSLSSCGDHLDHPHCEAHPGARVWVKLKRESKRCGSVNRPAVFEIVGDDDQDSMPPRPRGRLKCFRQISDAPRVPADHSIKEKKPAPTPHLCSCTRMCKPVKELLADMQRPFLILKGLSYLDASRHLKWVRDNHSDVLHIKQTLGQNTIVLAKKIFQGKLQEPPWISTPAAYEGIKIGRFQCPHPTCGWWSPVNHKGNSCPVCGGNITICSTAFTSC
jgi:hypothetical protein